MYFCNSFCQKAKKESVSERFALGINVIVIKLCT